MVRTIVRRFFWIKSRVAGQGKTKEIFSKGPSVHYSTDMHEQGVSVYAHDSADEIKLLRRNAKRRQAFLIKKIKLISPRRNIATERSSELQVAGRRYGRVPARDRRQSLGEGRNYRSFRIISDYFQSRLEDEESAASVRSRLVDDHSQTSRGSPKSQSRLREATERLEIARLELQQSEQRLSLVKSYVLSVTKS